MSIDVRKRALELEVAKNFPEAARLYAEIGALDKAAYMFLRANQPKAAAELYAKSGDPAKGAEMLLKGGFHEQAADLLARAGDFVAAAKAYLQAQDLDKAAAMYARGQRCTEAGEVYLQLRNFLEAGKMFEKAGDVKRSAAAYSQVVDSDEISKLRNREDMGRIAKILQHVRNFEKAAEIYIHSKDVVEAILMYLRIGELAPAARLYSNCQGDVGFDLMQHIPKDGTKAYADFAEMFVLARDFSKAARVYEDFDDFVKAGECYEKCDDYVQAAECFIRGEDMDRGGLMFERAGEHERAAALFEEAGNRLMAARNYERAGEFFRAGEIFYEMERYDKAIDLLQKVRETDDNYMKASALIAEVLREKGYLDLAVERYEHVVKGRPVDEENLPFYYNLALILMEKNQLDEAERLLKDAAKFRLSYRDVTDKLQLIKRMREDLARGVQSVGGDLAAARERERERKPQATVPSVPAPAPEAALAQSALVGRMEGFEFLRNTPIFENLTLDEMRAFWDICEKRVYGEEETIIQEGRPGEALFVLKSGSVRVVHERKGREEILTILYPGDHVGELSLINDSPTTATVKSAEETEVFAITRERFRKLLETNDRLSLKIYRAFIKTLSQRLIRTTDDFVAFRQAFMGAPSEES